MKTLEVGNINIEIVSKDIKNIHLAVYPPHGRVRLAMPKGVDEEVIKLFAISKLGWIRKQQRKFVEQDRQTSRKYIDRESHCFQGKRYLLRLIEQEGRPRVEITTKTYIDLHVHRNSTIDERDELLSMWYRKQLKEQIPAILDKWQSKMGVEVNSCVRSRQD